MEYTVYEPYEDGKATIDGGQFVFDCDPDDVDTAYDALAENVLLNNQNENSQDLIDFQNAKDDNVKVMLDDMEKMKFIGDWEAAAND